MSSPARTEPADPDVEPSGGRQRFVHARDAPVVAAVAAGGILGAEGRSALALALPSAATGWPAATFLVNVSGCLLIGGLMVALTELTAPHRLVRPFLGVGVLGGWTTFSTAMVDVVRLTRAGRPVLAAGYLLGTALAALLAVLLGALLTRAAAAGWRHAGVRRSRTP